jgi:hypothetical protein
VSSGPSEDARFDLLLPTGDPVLVGYDRPVARLVDLARRAVVR